MKKKAVTITIILVAIVSLLAAGCASGISESDYNRVVSERDQAMAQVASLESELVTAREQMTALEEQAGDLQDELAALEEQVATLEEQIAALQQGIARNFVKNSPTFAFDGIEGTLKLVETLYPDIENAWQFVFQFESRHAGYGDRTDQILAQVITPHEAVVTVEHGEVTSAVMDGVWNMLTQSMIL